MLINICYNPETFAVQGWSTTPFGENNAEVDVSEDHGVFRDPFQYKYVEGQLVIDNEFALNRAKKIKDRELNEACQKTILNGFDHVINGTSYHFSFDTEAQLNFQGAERVFSRNLVESIDWTVKNNTTGLYERIPITDTIMDELSVVILQHKSDNVSRYRDVLYKQLENAITVEEVEAIRWDSNEIPMTET
ncbi:hypothetical protein [Bacillus stercoris]|uniref:DUF4376 domain-containing protein n=1 Tax=Bacillus stercoris TaxID=2054641 RepID=UPI003CF8EC70